MQRDVAPRWMLPLLILLAFTGAGIGAMLTDYHLTGGEHPSPLFQSVCGREGGRCMEVLMSNYAALPGGMPLAAIGFVYFGGLALWYLVVGAANRRGRSWQALPLAAQVAGIVVSLGLIGVMLTRIHAMCGWCMLSHLINFLMLFLAWRIWPRDAAESDPPRPAPRLALAGLLLVAALLVLTLQWTVLAEAKDNSERATRYARTLHDDVDLQTYLHRRQPAHPLSAPPDAPLRGNRAAEHLLVIFSDFQCPDCRDVAQFTEHQLLPRFGDRLKVVYRHFPLGSTCNPWQKKTLHPHACEASFAAEAAREIGGNEAFWRMHDVLFAHQPSLANASWAALGRLAGLDGAAVAAAVSRPSPAARARIRQDAEIGNAADLKYTPTVFLDGRRLDEWKRLDLWQALLGEARGLAQPSR
jgi:protein-disulfide isomerase/uncharacterized membrane protein